MGKYVIYINLFCSSKDKNKMAIHQQSEDWILYGRIYRYT